jgi:hypothetical protein
VKYSPNLPAKTGIVIVGAGISDAMLAHRLRECGQKGEPLMGSTAASTALVQFEIDRHFAL